MAFYAALAVRDRAPGAALDASAAKAFTAEAAIENASASVQVHGGMGYTEQMTPHLYVKRARVLDQLFQDRRWHLARLLELPMAAA
jgi:alkylation response protein AidB-like acyl-CoA dehydrogenase